MRTLRTRAPPPIIGRMGPILPGPLGDLVVDDLVVRKGFPVVVVVVASCATITISTVLGRDKILRSPTPPHKNIFHSYFIYSGNYFVQFYLKLNNTILFKETFSIARHDCKQNFNDIANTMDSIRIRMHTIIQTSKLK